MIQDAHRGASATERRRRARRPVKGVRVSLPVDGKVLDVSPLGVAIQGSERLARGQNNRFLLRRGWHHLRINGRVRWCAVVKTNHKRADTDPPVYRAGIALEVPSTKALRFLWRCIYT